MDVSATAAPPPGSAQAGDLYVDLQSRTLWLGVDPGVDPSGFVLISDIMAQQAEDLDIRYDSRVYTDQQVALKANIASPVFTGNPQAPTPLAAAPDTSLATIGFVRSAMVISGAATFTHGMIMMFAGSLAEVGVGALASWAICDGANGTPDLRDRFVLGAGNKAVGAKNLYPYCYVTGGGAHSHTVNPTAITLDQMPYHAHGGTTNWMSSNHQHYVQGGTDGQGNHQHSPITLNGSSADNGDPGTLVVTASAQGNGARANTGHTNTTGNHGHNIGIWSGGVSENHYHQVWAEGGNVGHSHTLVGGGGQHNDHYLTSEQLRETLPYYALAFIMKL